MQWRLVSVDVSVVGPPSRVSMGFQWGGLDGRQLDGLQGWWRTSPLWELPFLHPRGLFLVGSLWWFLFKQGFLTWGLQRGIKGSINVDEKNNHSFVFTNLQEKRSA